MEKIILAGGCFWCLEAIFRRVRGVLSVHSGYTGGTTTNPTYEEVSRGDTGHTEAVEITFDPSVIAYENVLDIFFGMHDPTTLNRQGNDIGSQYRSAIFYTTEDQRELAEKKISSLTQEKIFDAPIVTEIRPLKVFYPAETYHERYYERNTEQNYCQAVINPKLAKLREKYKKWYRNQDK
jgi:peptide-methionine (S)-S-oxide reductase